MNAKVHGNLIANEGCDRCVCGNKYWEFDRCIDCGRLVETIEAEFVAIVGELAKDHDLRDVAAFGSAELASFDE